MIEIEVCEHYLILRPKGGPREYQQDMLVVNQIFAEDRLRINGGFKVLNPDNYTNIPIIRQAIEDHKHQLSFLEEYGSDRKVNRD